MDAIVYQKAEEALKKAEEAKSILDELSFDGDTFIGHLETPSDNLYLKAKDFVRVTDKDGYNDGNMTFNDLQVHSLTLKSNDGNSSAHLKMDDDDKGRLKIDVGDTAIWLDPENGNIYMRYEDENIHQFYSNGSIKSKDD